jgi:hypothetical protein
MQIRNVSKEQNEGKEGEVIGRKRKLHNKELHHIKYLLNIIKMI